MVIEYIWKLKLFLKSVYKTTIVPKCAFWNSHFYKNQRPLMYMTPEEDIDHE